MTSKLAASLFCCFYIGFWCSLNLLRWGDVKGVYVTSSSGWPMTQSHSLDKAPRGLGLSPYFEAQTDAVWINLAALILGTLLVFVCSRRLIEWIYPETPARRIVRPDFKLTPDAVDFRPTPQQWPFLPRFRHVLLSFAILAFLCANTNVFFVGGGGCGCIMNSKIERSTGFPLTFWRETTTIHHLSTRWQSQKAEQWLYGKLAFDALLGIIVFGGAFRYCRKYD